MSRKQLTYDQEATFGNPAVSSPIPDNSGAVYKPVYADRANIESIGEPVFAQREVTRGGYFEETPRPISICDGTGVPYQRRMGQVTSTIAGQTVGAGTTDIPDNDSLPLVAFLASSMVDNGAPAGTAGVVLGDAGNPITGIVGQVISVTDAGGLEVGEILSCVIDGITEYFSITYINGLDITVNPGPKVAFTGTEVFYRMRMLYIPNGQVSPGLSLTMRAEGDLWRDEANGCRASEIAVSVDEGEFIFNFTHEAPYVKSDHLDADVVAGTNVVEPNEPGGPGSQPLGARQVMGTTPSNDDSLSVVGTEIGSTAMDLDDMAVTATFTLEKRGVTDKIIACSEQTIVDVAVELSLTLSTPLSLVADDWQKKQNRLILLGAGRCGEGTGIAIMIPSAVLKADPNLRLMDTELVRQQLTYGLGAPKLDDTSGGLGGLAGSLFRIGLGVVGA